jgi:hypothetical protein
MLLLFTENEEGRDEHCALGKPSPLFKVGNPYTYRGQASVTKLVRVTRSTRKIDLKFLARQ